MDGKDAHGTVGDDVATKGIESTHTKFNSFLIFVFIRGTRMMVAAAPLDAQLIEIFRLVCVCVCVSVSHSQRVTTITISTDTKLDFM